jgi:hypothetical protein
VSPEFPRQRSRYRLPLHLFTFLQLILNAFPEKKAGDRNESVQLILDVPDRSQDALQPFELRLKI